jgi:hypothetical protein
MAKCKLKWNSKQQSSMAIIKQLKLRLGLFRHQTSDALTLFSLAAPLQQPASSS